MKINKTCVIGLGYIGLPTAALLASLGTEVYGLEINSKVVEVINSGEIHIVEPDLQKMVKDAVNSGLLRAGTEPEHADVFVVAVPTPFKSKVNGIPEPDISYIEAAIVSIAPVLKHGNIVILESTSPVGTTRQMCSWLKALRPDLDIANSQSTSLDIHVAYCPERVLPGNVITELVTNDRTVGGVTPACSAKASEFYKIFCQGDCFLTNPETAEMAKLTENSFRDVQIAFANELSMICDSLSINVWELIRLANLHPRVDILEPGPGVGGHCIAVDPWFIVNKSPKQAKLIRLAREINDEKIDWVIDKIYDSLKSPRMLEKKAECQSVKVILYGLTFKPDIDDLRESPSIKIANALCENLSIELLAVEPNVNQLDEKLEKNCKLIGLELALEQEAIHVFLVNHSEFKLLNAPKGITIDIKGLLG